MQGMGFNPNSPQGSNGPNNQNMPQMQGMNHNMQNKSFSSGELECFKQSL